MTTNTFTTDLLELLKREENMERFNEIQTHVKVWNNNDRLFFVYDKNKETRNFYEYLALSVRLYILRTAIKAIKEYEVENTLYIKRSKEVNSESKPNYQVSKKLLLMMISGEQYSGKTIQDQLLHALNQDDYLSALQACWKENRNLIFK